jgi:hypothetical protein
VPALKRRARVSAWLALAVLGALACAAGCKAKATAAQCDELLDHYAVLAAREAHPDASAEEVEAARRQARDEARGDDQFKNCSSEVSQSEYDCAMRASTPDSVEKCLE